MCSKTSSRTVELPTFSPEPPKPVSAGPFSIAAFDVDGTHNDPSGATDSEALEFIGGSEPRGSVNRDRHWKGTIWRGCNRCSPGWQPLGR